MVVGVVSDVVMSFVINADQNGRMTECLVNALGGKNLNLGPRRIICCENYIWL